MGKFILGLALCVSLGARATSFKYEGSFQRASYSGNGECDQVFDLMDYDSQLFLMPQMRAVIHFSRTDKQGFFQALNLYGLNGGMGDVGAENEWKDGDSKWRVKADGIFSHEVLFLNIKVEKFQNGAKEPICEAIAEYSGTN